jgi:hypothetical protein
MFLVVCRVLAQEKNTKNTIPSHRMSVASRRHHRGKLQHTFSNHIPLVTFGHAEMTCVRPTSNVDFIFLVFCTQVLHKDPKRDIWKNTKSQVSDFLSFAHTFKYGISAFLLFYTHSLREIFKSEPLKKYTITDFRFPCFTLILKIAF